MAANMDTVGTFGMRVGIGHDYAFCWFRRGGRGSLTWFSSFLTRTFSPWPHPLTVHFVKLSFFMLIFCFVCVHLYICVFVCVCVHVSMCVYVCVIDPIPLS